MKKKVQKKQEVRAGKIAVEKSKEVKFIVVSGSPIDPFDFFSFRLGSSEWVNYFTTVAEVIAFLKENPTQKARVFEVSSELKTQSRLELAI